MPETIDKLIFALDADLTALKSAFAQADVQASNAGKKIGDSIAKPIDEASKKAGKSVSDNLDKGMKDGADAAVKHSKRIRDEMDKIAPAVTNGQKVIQQSVKLTASEVQNLTYQINDVVTGLAMGQRPMQVLLQQGAQFVQIFQRTGVRGVIGGIGAALGAIVSPAVAAGGAIALIGTLATVSAYQAEAAAIRIRNTLAASGFASGASADDIKRAAQGIAAGGQYSVRGAQDVLGIGAARGNVPSSLFGLFASASTGLSSAIPGSSQTEAAAKLEQLLADPAAAAKELNEQFKLLDAATTKQVNDLVASGRYFDAQKTILLAVNDRFKNLGDGAWSLAKTFRDIGHGISNFWNNTGNLLSGNAQTKQDRLYDAQGSLAYLQDRQKRLEAIDPKIGRTPLQAFELSTTIPNKIAALTKEIADLRSGIAKDAANTKAGETAAAANRAIGAGLADSERGAGSFTKTLEGLQQQLNRDQLAVRLATETHSQFTKQLTDQRDAAKIALEAFQKYGSPAAQAQQRALDAQRVASAPLASRGFVQAQVDAENRRRQNLMNPATALQAESIYQADLRAARFNTRDDNRADQKAEQQRRNLAAIQAEADGEEKLAAAYDQGASAVERARIAAEAHNAFVKEEIKDEKAYADALQRRAFAQASAAVSQRRIDEAATIAGLRKVAGAGGRVSAIQSATDENNAIAATAKLFAAAQTDGEKAKAAAEYLKALSDEQAKSALNREIAANKENATLQQNIDMMKLQHDLQFEDEGLRAQKIADLQTIQQLENAGFKAGTAEYEAEFQKRQALNRTSAALGVVSPGDQIYGSIRNGLGDVLAAGTQGFKSLGQAAGSFLSQLAQLSVQLYIIKPLLTAALGSGPSSGGGFLGSLFGGVLSGLGLGGLLGGGSTGNWKGSIMDDGTVIGGARAMGGPVDPAMAYLVGENGPELFKPHAAGNIIPMTGPNTTGGGGSTMLNTNLTATIVVQGTGDKELQANMEAGARKLVTTAIEANNRTLARTQRNTLIGSNRRALP